MHYKAIVLFQIL